MPFWMLNILKKQIYFFYHSSQLGLVRVESRIRFLNPWVRPQDEKFESKVSMSQAHTSIVSSAQTPS